MNIKKLKILSLNFNKKVINFLKNYIKTSKYFLKNSIYPNFLRVIFINCLKVLKISLSRKKKYSKTESKFIKKNI